MSKRGGDGNPGPMSVEKPLEVGGTIPLALAAPLMMEHELPNWTWGSFAESWDTMRPLLLGGPCGARSSLFVTQETGQGLKSLWLKMVDTGMFGPIRA